MENEEQTTQNPLNIKYAIGNTRLLDNHYDPKVHEKPWLANGILRDYKYEYSDSGLGFVMKKPYKLRNFKDRHEQAKEVEEMNKKSKGFRYFKEYDNIDNNDVLITIEYCTNCKQHQGSTRHDEEKYAYFAHTLKREIMNQYSTVKVILKPLLITENEETAEVLYLRSRIGAFEVQVFGKNNKGQVTQKCVFSKLHTKSWPSIPKVVDEISNFLPKDDFIVRLIEPGNDSEDSEHSDQQGAQNNKLKGLHVILRPVIASKKPIPSYAELSNSKAMNDSSRFTRNVNPNSRPNSALIRPQSAFSSASSKSTATMRKKSNSREDKQKVENTQPKEYVEQSDNLGVVLFKQIPYNIYEIEVLETQHYLPEKRIVNIFEMAESGDPLKEEIILKDQTMGFCRVKLLNNGMYFPDASILVAKKISDKNSTTAAIREKEGQTGVFEFMIDPGEYILSMSKIGFGEKKEEIFVEQGLNEYIFDMKSTQSSFKESRKPSEKPQPQPQPQPNSMKAEERPSSRQRPVSSKGRPASASRTGQKVTQDPVTQENRELVQAQKANDNEIKSGTPQNQDYGAHEESKQKERVKSAMVKKVEFSVFDIDSNKPVPGVFVILEEIQFKGVTNEQGKCFVPVNKLKSGKLILDHSEYFGMVEEYGDEDFDLKNLTEKRFDIIPRPNDINEVQIRFIPGNKVRCAKFSVLFEGENDKKDVIVQHKEGGKDTIILKNLLKKHGVFRIIAEVTDIDEFLDPESMLILSHYEDCDQLFIFPPSEDMLEGQKLIWDGGFFADPAINPQFVEINGYSKKDITLYSYLKEYQMLLNYLHNSKSDIKTLLGFKEKRRIEKEGDIFVPKEVIYASLDKYGLEVKNIDHLISSAQTHEGLYSYRECERRFGSLRQPFNFVKGNQKSNISTLTHDESNDEEEYIFEDDQ